MVPASDVHLYPICGSWTHGPIMVNDAWSTKHRSSGHPFVETEHLHLGAKGHQIPLDMVQGTWGWNLLLSCLRQVGKSSILAKWGNLTHLPTIFPHWRRPPTCFYTQTCTCDARKSGSCFCPKCVRHNSLTSLRHFRRYSQSDLSRAAFSTMRIRWRLIK